MEKYIDIHCHPTMKPFSKSFKKGKVNSPRPSDKNSIWYYNPPTLADKLLNYAGTLTKFSQADFISLAKGNVGLICASLYPIEKSFLTPKMGTGIVTDLLENFVLGIGKERIDHIQAVREYFTDLQAEYDYLKQLHGVKVKINRSDAYSYKLVKNFLDIEENEQSNENIISVVVSIEGSHVFNTGLGELNSPDNEVLENVRKVKNWEYRPFFITLSHHFYNNISGHSQSLAPILAKMMDQSPGMNTGFTDLGKKVLHLLLDNSEGKRILIDIKHLSPLARKQYFEILDTEYASENIPIIASHAGVTGRQSIDKDVVNIPSSHGIFLDAEINFYDDEILQIARRGGMIGLQMDERRVADHSLLKQIDGKIARRKILFYRSGLIWNQVRHIAELLDREGYYSWGLQTLGTDYDGIVDPLNGFWTAEELPFLDDYLLKHAYNYMISDGKNLKIAANRNADPEEIVSRIMTDNAYEFFRKYFV